MPKLDNATLLREIQAARASLGYQTLSDKQQRYRHKKSGDILLQSDAVMGEVVDVALNQLEVQAHDVQRPNPSIQQDLKHIETIQAWLDKPADMKRLEAFHDVAEEQALLNKNKASTSWTDVRYGIEMAIYAIATAIGAILVGTGNPLGVTTLFAVVGRADRIATLSQDLSATKYDVQVCPEKQQSIKANLAEVRTQGQEADVEVLQKKQEQEAPKSDEENAPPSASRR